MKKISLWAKAHPQQTRIYIVVSYLLLNVLGIVIGQLLNLLSIELPILLLNSSILVFIICGLAYPSKNKKENYIFRKTCDSVLISTTFLMIVFAGNRYGGLTGLFTATSYHNQVQATSIKDSTKRSYTSLEAFKLSMKDKDGKMLKWKERRKLLKSQVKAIKNSDDLTDAGKVALTIGCVIVALGLLYLVAAGACSLSCSGAEGGAILLGLGGLALVIVLFVIAMKAIYKKKKPIKPFDNKPVEEAQKVDGD